jgi:hypothetical protein
MQQAAAAQGIDGFGFVLPRYYRIAANEPGVFHDIVRGGNLVAQSGPGWDYATGVGSPDVAALTDALIRDVQANP